MSFDNYFKKIVKDQILIIILLFIIGFASIYYVTSIFAGPNLYYQLKIKNKLLVHETRDLDRLSANIPKGANFDIVKKILKHMHEIYYYNKDNNTIVEKLFYSDDKLKLREVSEIKKLIVDFKFTSELSSNEILEHIDDYINELNMNLPKDYQQESIIELFNSQLNEIYDRISDFYSEHRLVLTNANIKDPVTTENHIEFNKVKDMTEKISTNTLIELLKSDDSYNFIQSQIILQYNALINEYNLLSEKTHYVLSEFDLIYPDYVKPIEVISFEKKNNQKLYLNEFNKILISLFLTFALVIAYLIGNYFYLLVKSSINDK